MKKALIVSTVSRQFTLFERENIDILNKLGYEVHCAANYSDATDSLDELNIVRHNIDIQRSPISPKQIKAYFQLKKIMNDEKFDLVHCHAPMGGILGRICSKVTNTRPVVYTAHGFHFFKGAPIINNLVYKNIERLMARYTDILITINNEDYEAAKNFSIRDGGKVIKIPGIGIENELIGSVIINKKEKKMKLGIPENSFLICSVGELNKNKNHESVIRAIAKLNNPNIYYIVCGIGKLKEYLSKLSYELGISNNVKIIGFRNDIYEINKASDLFVFMSYREGLSVALMEAMASGLPVICSNIRGNNELIEEEKGGYLINPDSITELSQKISLLEKNKKLREDMGRYNSINAINYDKKIVRNKMYREYEEILK